MFQEKEKAGKNAKGKGTKETKKKGKKERAEEREKERNKIEKSWDVPVPIPPTPPIIANGKSKTPVKSASFPPTNGPKASVDPGTVRSSILSTLSSQNVNVIGMSRNEFVREVLTLIHTDKNFVDTLWQEYALRSE